MAFVDPYFDETIGTLRNLLGARSSQELRQLEPQVVFANELELSSINIPRTNDFAELQLIHKQLFKGIYDWAGEVRTVDIRKNSTNSEFFLIVDKIAGAAIYVFSELTKEDYLLHLPKEKFIDRISYFYDQLNYIHPFREGNGRTQRIFWSRVANDAGYSIDWSSINEGENDEASRLAAEQLDTSGLIIMFSRIVSEKQ